MTNDSTEITMPEITGNLVTIRPCRQDDWPAFAECVYAMWRDIGVAPAQIKPNWSDEVRRFLEKAVKTEQFAGYVAVADGRVVGSAGGQFMSGLSPQILEPSCRQRGYLWGVYVAPTHRGCGVARALTEAVVSHLQTLGCTQVLLHASPAGRPVYEKIGFVPSSEMQLMLPPAGNNYVS